MLKLYLWTALVILVALLACGEQTPTPGPGAATTPLPANSSTPEATATPSPPPEPTPVPTQAPGIPTPGPTPAFTATKGASNPASTPATPGISPTGAPTEPTVSPTQVPANLTSTPAEVPSTTLMITIAPVPTDMPKYERNDWKHWEDHDGDCQDARQEVLIAESLVPVTYKTDRECRVETGWWYGAFTGTHIEDPGNLDIDHLVPLKNAHNSGGWPWTADRREEYANYLGDDDHLIAVLDRANQSKGARGPEEWRPPDETYWCQFATD